MGWNISGLCSDKQVPEILPQYIKLLTGSQIMTKEHILSTKVCGLVSFTGWASVNRVIIFKPNWF